MTTEIATTTMPPITEDERRQAEAIRRVLPGQANASRMDEARLRYRTVSFRQLSRQIRHTLPFRWFRVRRLHEWSIRDYPRHIPDAVLLKYEEARGSDLFRSIHVFEPSYERQMPAVRSDPWLVGKVSGQYATIFENADRMAVIAYWE